MSSSIKPQLFAIARGEKIIASLLTYAQQNQLMSASISGLGALKDPILGYYNLPEKKYQYKMFEGLYELISLNGNITKFNNKYIIHAHVALSNKQFHLIGGHLQEATVSVTAEITIIPFDSTYQRKFNSNINLNLIPS